MSIIHTFDNSSSEIIDPKQVVKKIEGFPKTLVSVFSRKAAELFLTSFEMEQIGVMDAEIIVPIYRFRYKGRELGFYHSLLGGAPSAMLLEEVIAKGAENVLFYGSCGSLDKDITGGHLIVPVSACRDEGVSYHYASASDYIEIGTADRLSEIFHQIDVPHLKSKVWTTDSFYRETKNNMEARKAEGCSAVDMECASVMAVGAFRGINVYQFLYAADCLDGDDWDIRILEAMPGDLREKIMRIALETAIRI